MIIKYNDLGREQMSNILKLAAERNDIIEISSKQYMIYDDKGVAFLCRKFEIVNSFICYYITEKLYQKMVERDIITKVD